MINPFVIVPLIICVYEILSLILPLRLPLWAKVIASLILLSGIVKLMLYRRTESGFDIIELPYAVYLAVSLVFNFMIVALFMLVIKDIAFILCKLIFRSFPASHASLFVLVVAMLSTLWGTYQGTRIPDVRVHEVSLPGLSRELDGLKVAMLVDIHTSTLNNRAFVQEIVNRTNALNPDVILIPGDFVDGQIANRYADIEPLRDLRAKHGVYGTTGNHEYYFDLKGWLGVFREFGIRMLENEHVTIESGDARLIIAGVPDPTGGNHNTELAVKGVPEGVPVILMDHRPEAARENANYGVTMQVSGHTHGGQMPGVYELVRRANAGFIRGWYDVGSMKLYVSPGTSEWSGFALRLFDPSEISLFVLRAML